MLVSNNLEFLDIVFDFIGYFFNSISNNYPYSLKYVEINRKEGFFFFAIDTHSLLAQTESSFSKMALE